eukprot:4079918-Amphidinium_carterae.1
MLQSPDMLPQRIKAMIHQAREPSETPRVQQLAPDVQVMITRGNETCSERGPSGKKGFKISLIPAGNLVDSHRLLPGKTFWQLDIRAEA